MPDSNNNKASRNKQSNAVKRKNQVNGTASTAHNGNKHQNENSNTQTVPPSKKQKVVEFNGILITCFCRC